MDVTEALRIALHELRAARVSGNQQRTFRAWQELRALLAATEPQAERLWS